jgi:heme/copper-type cytochrome/quinol oxidase subunit 2
LERAKLFEATTIVASATILLVLASLSVQVLYQIDNPPRGEDFVTIRVVGRQFAWTFIYPDGTIRSSLDIEAGRLYRLELVSEDVIHGLGARELGILRDVVPGYTNVLWLKVDQPGKYLILCREYCGWGHYSMTTSLNVSGCAGGSCPG